MTICKVCDQKITRPGITYGKHGDICLPCARLGWNFGENGKPAIFPLPKPWTPTSAQHWQKQAEYWKAKYEAAIKQTVMDL